MSASIVALTVFAAAISGLGAMFLIMQQLIAWRQNRTAAVSSSIVLRRIPRPTSQGVNSGVVAKFDRWFLTLLRESGFLGDPVATALLLILAGLLLGSSLWVWQEDMLWSSMGMAMGMALPLLYFQHRQRKRTRLLQEQLPPALEMLARSVRAGQSLDQALQATGRQSPEPLAAEFRWCATQLEMGLSMASVMRHLVERVRLPDMRIFTTTLTVHRQTGGNVAHVLERLARVVRSRLSYRRQLRVATAAGRASAVLVGLIGPLIFLFFLFFRTQYLQAMLTTPLGRSLLIVAVTLQLIGLIWTSRLLKPTY